MTDNCNYLALQPSASLTFSIFLYLGVKKGGATLQLTSFMDPLNIYFKKPHFSLFCAALFMGFCG